MLINVYIICFFGTLIPYISTQKSLYITPYTCKPNLNCDGLTYYTPIDSIMLALVRYNNTDQPLQLLLIPDPIIDHYILGGEIRSDGSIYYNYTNDSVLVHGSIYSQKGYMNNGLVINIANLTIKPLLCIEFIQMNYPNCINDTSQMMTIYLKTSFLIIQTKILNISNIILDGNEDIYLINTLNMGINGSIWINLQSNRYIDDCIYKRHKCCNNNWSNANVYCSRFDIPYMKILALFDTNQGLFSFISTSMSNENNPIASINIQNSILSNIWLPYRTSILYLTYSSYSIKIDTTSFLNNFFQDSNIQIIPNLNKGSGSGDQNSNNIILSNINYTNLITKFNNNSAAFISKANTLMTYQNMNPISIINVFYRSVSLFTSNLFSILICLAYRDPFSDIQNTNIQISNSILIGLDNIGLENRSMIEYDNDFSIYINNVYNFNINNLTIIKVIKPIGIINTVYIEFIQCKFIQNIGKYGGVISLIMMNIASMTSIIPSSYQLVMKDSVFENNSAEQGGGLYYNGNGYSAWIMMSNISFNNNSATKLIGGAFAININDPFMNTIIDINNITTTNHNAAIGGAIFLKLSSLNMTSPISASSTQRFQISITSSQFISNHAYLIQSQTYNSTFDTYLLLSNLPTKLTGYGGAIYSICNGICFININNNKYTNNTADIGAGALYTYINEGIFESNSFINNSAMIGGALYIQRTNVSININSKFVVKDTIFRMNNAVEMINQDTLSTNLELYLNTLSASGGAIYIEPTQSNQYQQPLNITNCEFSHNTASDYGGAIQGNLLNITYSNFKNNKATQGGALFGANYQIYECNFTTNKAINSSLMYGKGGAIYLKEEFKAVNRTSINNTIFSKNNADLSGGAIYISYNPPLIDFPTILFQNNNATIYGPDLAAFAVCLIIWNPEFQPNIQYNINLDFNSTTTATLCPYNYQSVNIPSGYMTSKLSFALLDIYGQIVKEDISSELTINPINKKYNIELIISPYTIIASNGIYIYPTETQFTYQPGLRLDISMLSNGIILSPWKENQLILNITFNTCQPGEIYQITTCYKCPPGYYSLETDPFYQGTCHLCDMNAICFGGNLIYPKKGYWRKNNTANSIVRCSNSDACLGSAYVLEYATITGNCSYGYEGNLCGICAEGFTKLGLTNQCYNCQMSWWYYIILILIYLFKVAIILWSIHWTVLANNENGSNADHNEKNIQIRKTVLVKIIVNYTQLLAFAQNFQVRIPDFVKETLGHTSKLSFNFSDMFSLDCYLHYKLGILNLNRYYIKAIMTIGIPMALILVCIIGIIMPYRQLSRFRCLRPCLIWLANNKIYMYVSLTVFIVYFYQGVLQSAFAFFQCQNLYNQDNPEYYLVNEPEILCWSDQHITWSLSIAIPTILLWGIAIPIILSRINIKYQTRIEIQKKLLLNKYNAWYITKEAYITTTNYPNDRIDSGKVDECLSNPITLEANNIDPIKNDNIHSIPKATLNPFHEKKSKIDDIKYSFLAQGYKLNHPIGSIEVYIMLRKFIMILILLFIPVISNLLTTLLCTIVVSLALLLQFKSNQFEDSIPNVLENTSMISVIIVYNVGIYYQGQGTETLDMIMIICLFFGFGLFLGKWFIEYLRAISISNEGQIGTYIIKVLGNPEGLSKANRDPDSKSTRNTGSKPKDTLNRNPHSESISSRSNKKVLKKQKIDDNTTFKSQSHTHRISITSEMSSPQTLIVHKLKNSTNTSPIVPLSNLTVTHEASFVLKKYYVDQGQIRQGSHVSMTKNLTKEKLGEIINLQEDEIDSKFALDEPNGNNINVNNNSESFPPSGSAVMNSGGSGVMNNGGNDDAGGPDNNNINSLNGPNNSNNLNNMNNGNRIRQQGIIIYSNINENANENGNENENRLEHEEKEEESNYAVSDDSRKRVDISPIVFDSHKSHIKRLKK